MAVPLQLDPYDREQLKKRPQPVPAPTAFSTNAAEFEAKSRQQSQPPPAPGLAGYQRQNLPAQLDPWDRMAATGESVLGWMTRRYGIAGNAGLDPMRMPITAIHDLATQPLDDVLLRHVIQVTAPLQDDVAARLAARRRLQQAEQAPGAQAGSLGVAGPAIKVPDNLSGFEGRRVSLRTGLPGPLVGSTQLQVTEPKVPGFPKATDVLTEIAADPAMRDRLSLAPWIVDFLKMDPKTPQQMQDARSRLKEAVVGGRGLYATTRDAALALLDDGSNPLDVAYWLTANEAFAGEGDLRDHGIVSPSTVLERARQNRDHANANLSKFSGGLLGRPHQDLLAFDARDDVDRLRLEASGLALPSSTGSFHPGQILDAISWPWHKVSQAGGAAGQYLIPLSDWANRHLPAGAGERLVQQGGKWVSVPSPQRAFPRSPSDAWRRSVQGGGLGGTLASFSGLKPGDKDFDRAAAVLDFAAAVYLDPVIAAGKIGEGVKVARSIPAGEAVTGASRLERATSQLVEPGGDVPRSRLARLAYQVAAKSPEALADTPKAKAAFDSMARESSAIAIADRYRLPGPMAKAVADTRDPLRVRDLFVAGIHGSIPRYERWQIEQKMAANAAEVERLQRLEPTDQPGLFDVGPAETSSPHQARIDGLLAEQGRLKADLDRGERPAFEVRSIPRETLAGSYRQAVKRLADQPARRGQEGGLSRLDVVLRTSRTAERRALGKLPSADQEALGAVDSHAERLRQDLAVLYGERVKAPGAFDSQIAGKEKALDALAKEKAGVMARGGLSDRYALWQARDRFNDPQPVARALSWAYNHSASMRGAFERLPRTGDVVSTVDRTQGMRVLERLGQALDVDRRSIDALVDSYLAADGPEEVLATVKELLKRAESLHPEYSNEILRLYSQNTESLFWVRDDAAGSNGWTATKRFMGDDMAFSQPHLSSELVDEIPLPDWRAARELRSLRGRASEVLKGGVPDRVDAAAQAFAARHGIRPAYFQALLTPADRVAGGVGSVVATTWAKLARAQDFAMSRVWTPAVLLRGGWTQRVVGEEQFRMAFVGLASAFFHPGEWWRSIKGAGEFERFADLPEELGVSYVRDLMQKTPVGMKVRKGASGYERAWRGELKQLHAADEIKVLLNYVANEGEGAGATTKLLKWLNTHPEGKDVWQQMKPIVEGQMHLTQKDWADTLVTRVRDKTRGNQALISMARDGELRMPVDQYVALKFGGQPPSRVTDLLDQVRRDPATDVRSELEHRLGGQLVTGAGGALKVRLSLSDDDAVERLLAKLPDDQKPNFVKGQGYAWKDDNALPQWLPTLFDWLGGKPTTFLSRSPAYRQFAAGEYKRLRTLGVDEVRATDRARRYGIDQVKHLLFELGERSALHDQMRAVMPFLNAWQEVTERWFAHIPARQGMVVGQAALARKVVNAFDLARGEGLVYQNDQGDWVSKLPGFDQLVTHLVGVPMRAEFNLRGLNMLSQPPGLSPITLAALTKLPGVNQMWNHPGPLKPFMDLLTPYGPEVTLGPAWAGRAVWALTKKPPPWEVFSSDYQKTLWDGTVIDAMRVLDAKSRKDTGTGVLETIAKLPEGAEKDAAFNDFLRDAESMGRHFYAIRAGTGFLLPAQPQYYWPNRKEQTDFYNALNALPQGSPARKAMYDKLVEDHPELTSYLVAKSVADPEVSRPEAGGKFSLEAYWDQVRSGARTRLTPDQWEKFAAGAVDYQQVQHRYHQAVAASGTTATERLRNYGTVMAASDQRAASLDRLALTNPTWKTQFDRQIADSRVAKGEGRQTYEQHVATQFASDLKVISDLANDTPLEDEIDFGALRTARRSLLDRFQTTYNDANLTGVDRDVASYFKDVFDPYFTQLDQIYAQAGTLPKAERGPLFEQARQLKNGFSVPAGMPGPEEVLWGMADPEEQKNLVAKWATNPPGWLTDFQRTQLDLPVDNVHTQFWDVVNKAEDAAHDYIRAQHWASNQREAVNVMDGFDAWRTQVAKANGLSKELDRDNMTPFARAFSQGLTGGPEWQPIAAAVSGMQRVLAASSDTGTPLTIDSQVGRPMFDAFTAWLESYRRSTPELDSQLDRWGTVTGGKDKPLIGSDLYRSFFFNAFVVR